MSTGFVIILVHSCQYKLYELFNMSTLLIIVCPSLLHHGEMIMLIYHWSLSQEVMWWADSESQVRVSWWELWSHKPLLLLQCCQSSATWVARVHCICRQHVGSLLEEGTLQQNSHLQQIYIKSGGSQLTWWE